MRYLSAVWKESIIQSWWIWKYFDKYPALESYYFVLLLLLLLLLRFSAELTGESYDSTS